jgi:hypothetical protein
MALMGAFRNQPRDKNDAMTMLKWTMLLLAALSPGLAFATEAVDADEDRIRKVVEQMLHAKDKRISALETRLNELEQLTKTQQGLIQQLQTEKSRPDSPAVAEPAPQVAAAPQPKSASPLAKILPLKKKEDPKAEEEDKGPKVSGFMDVTAQTKSNGNQPFNLGVVELDLDRIMSSEHFAASAALDWFPYGVTPNAQIGAGFVDFHLYDASVPVRGRIFQEPGFHIQAGQFDLPFASDYQFFAAKDRLTITPPITTQRIQQSGINPSNGGFNAAGLRTYGIWNQLSYAAYYTDSLFSDGSAVGGRLGYHMNNPYRLHKRSDLPILDIGISGLVDMDKSEHVTDKVYAIDLGFNYGSLRLVSEFMMHESDRSRTDGNPAFNENAYHVTLIGNLEEWLKHPLYVYGRYEEWLPRFDSVTVDDAQYTVKRIPELALGLGYRFNEFLMLKLEYSDTLGHQTEEPGFQKRVGIAQLVATF